MNLELLLHRASRGEKLSLEEGLSLYQEAPLAALIEAANIRRLDLHSEGQVGWIIDRNVNITNICFSFCKFCNFCKTGKDDEAYVTQMDEYRQKIKELEALGGDQLLLQGGMHPELGIEFYEDLYRNLKSEFPHIKLHTLGPPEVIHIAKKSELSVLETLERLRAAGLDSLPGAGAEILVDRVRDFVSPAKCSSQEWLDVMRLAHQINLPTSATMMFGHVETEEERIRHLISLREVQEEVPDGHYGFINFVPWPFMDDGTNLKLKSKISNTTDAADYLRLIAISRLLLTNIPNIQASWLTVGPSVGQLALHAGANDFGSIMIEENVVSSAGANFQMDSEGIKRCIKEAGFIPYRRNQKFEAFIPPEN